MSVQQAPVENPSAAELELHRARAKAEIELRKLRGTWDGGVRAHTEYQGRPVAWIVEKLGVAEHTIRWSLNPEYQSCYCTQCVKAGNAGKPHLWDGDIDPLVTALDLIFQGKSVALSSGTTTAKTFAIGACGTLAFLAIHEDSIVMSVAPKQELLLKNMWKEIGRFWPRFKAMFPRAQLFTGNLRMKDGVGEQEVWAASAFGAGVGADEELAQKLKGFHQAKMLWIVEEMPGVEPPIIETIVKTATASFNPIVGLGNPEHEHDPLAMFGKRPWVTPLRISAYDFPNVVCGREVIPGGRSRESIARDLADADGNEEDSRFLSQVRGVAPKQAANALVRHEWLEAAAKRYEDPAYRIGGKAMGIDLANSSGGDKAAISRWQGACLVDVQAFQCPDATKLGEDIVEEVTAAGSKIDGRHVGIDSAGLGGPVFKMMRRMGLRGLRAINGATKPLPTVDEDILWSTAEMDDRGRLRATGPRVAEPERYDNLRSQGFWRLREDLRLGRIALKLDRELFEELTAHTYEAPAGKIIVCDKDAVKRVLLRSPDKADAVMYGNLVRPRAWIPKGENVKDDDIVMDTRNRDWGLEKRLAEQAKLGRREEQRFRRVFGRRRA